MHLSYRTARPDDLARHFPAMGEAFAYPPDLRANIPQLWAEWLRGGVLMAHVIERHEARSVVVEAIGAMVFLADGVIEDLRRGGRPYVGAELMRRALCGEKVVLSPEAMRSANRDGGLTLMILADPRGRRGLEEEHYRRIVSSSAVKKRWVSVYEQVSEATPGWLESEELPGEARGSEKRRHLLNYLRQHPEELHPACARRD